MVLAGVSSLAAVFQSGASAYRALAPLDLTIIAAYFLVVFGIGFYFSRKARGRPFRVAGLPDSVDPWLGLCSVLPA